MQILSADYFGRGLTDPSAILIDGGIHLNKVDARKVYKVSLKAYSEVKLDDNTVMSAKQVKALQKRNALLEEEND